MYIYIYVYQFILRSISLPFESPTVNHTALQKDKLNSNRLSNGLIHVQNYRSLFDLGKPYLALTSKNLELYVSNDKHNNYKTAIVLKRPFNGRSQTSSVLPRCTWTAPYSSQSPNPKPRSVNPSQRLYPAQFPYQKSTSHSA